VAGILNSLLLYLGYRYEAGFVPDDDAHKAFRARRIVMALTVVMFLGLVIAAVAG
jgi:hypothetical protein